MVTEHSHVALIKTLTGYGANIFRLRDGKVVEFWGAPHDPYGFDELIG
jgi:hypothetical protein